MGLGELWPETDLLSLNASAFVHVTMMCWWPTLSHAQCWALEIQNRQAPGYQPPGAKLNCSLTARSTPTDVSGLLCDCVIMGLEENPDKGKQQSPNPPETPWMHLLYTLWHWKPLEYHSGVQSWWEQLGALTGVFKSLALWATRFICYIQIFSLGHMKLCLHKIADTILSLSAFHFYCCV